VYIGLELRGLILDRFERGLHDSQDVERDEYSSCAGCREIIYCDEDDILDIYGMSVHDDIDCIKKSVEAKRIVMVNER
jgi:hypothetical protein